MRQDNKAVALRWLIQDLKQRRFAVAHRAQRQILQQPNVGMVHRITLRVSAIAPRVARQSRGRDRVAPPGCVTRRRFMRSATEHPNRVAQERVAPISLRTRKEPNDRSSSIPRRFDAVSDRTGSWPRKPEVDHQAID